MSSSPNNLLVVNDDLNQLLSHLKLNCSPSKAISNSQKLEFMLNTKYYASSILLHNFDSLRTLAIWHLSNKEIPAQSLCLFMKRSQSNLDLIQLDTISEYFNFDSKIIACYVSSIPQPFAVTLNQWATDRGYEIVDLEPSEEDVEYFKEINEKYGFDRIVEILEGTTWDKKDMKSVKAMTAAAAKLMLDEDESSEELDQFDGELDAKDKQMLELLMNSDSILDYYIKQGIDCYPAEGEVSKVEEQELNEKKAKIREKKKKKAKAKAMTNKGDNGANELSDDVGIELDKDDTAIPEPSETKEDASEEKKLSDESAKEGPIFPVSFVEDKEEDHSLQQQDDDDSLQRMLAGKCFESMLGDNKELGMEIIGEINDLKKDLTNKPRSYRLEMAEKISSAIYKSILNDEEDDDKEGK